MSEFLYSAKLVRILDGDTCEFDLSKTVEIDCGFHVKQSATFTLRQIIRFYGINTPELKAPGDEGEKARDYLTQLLSAAKEIRVQTIAPDKYGKRYLGVVMTSEVVIGAPVWTNVNREMVLKGFAVEYKP